MERDFWFYRRRATEEIWAAKRSITAPARERHEALARSFIERLERMEEGELLSEPGGSGQRSRERDLEWLNSL